MPRYSFRFDEATIGDLQARMESGRLSSRALVRAYLRRIDTIDRAGPGRLGLRSVLEVNPDADRLAAQARRDRGGAAPQRRCGDPRQDQPERVVQHPLTPLVQRLERPRRADPQPLRAGPLALW